MHHPNKESDVQSPTSMSQTYILYSRRSPQPPTPTKNSPPRRKVRPNQLCRPSYSEPNPFLKKSINRILNKDISSQYIQFRDLQISAKEDLLRRYYTYREAVKRRTDIWKFYQFAITKPKIYCKEFAKLYFKHFYLKRKYREEMMMELLSDMPDSELYKLDVCFLENYAQSKKSILMEIKGKSQSLLENIHALPSPSNRKVSFGISISQILGSSDAMAQDSMLSIECNAAEEKNKTAGETERWFVPSMKSVNTTYTKGNFKKSLKNGLTTAKPAEIESVGRLPAKELTVRKNIVKNINDKLSKVKIDKDKVKTSNIALSLAAKKSTILQGDKTKLKQTLTTNWREKLPSQNAFKDPQLSFNKLKVDDAMRRASMFNQIDKLTKNIEQLKPKSTQLFEQMHKSNSSKIKQIATANKIAFKSATSRPPTHSGVSSQRVVNTSGSMFKNSGRKRTHHRETSIGEKFANSGNKGSGKWVRAEGSREKFGSLRTMRLFK